MTPGENGDHDRPTILVLLGCFSTGVEAMGPNQSLIGMARALSARYRFRVLAEAVAGDGPGTWSSVAGLEQMPLRKGLTGARGLRRAINETPHDLIISNGFFDTQFTLPLLIYRRFGLIARKPTLIAPRGEFSPGALTISPRRKRAYLAMARLLGLLGGEVAIQATTATEAEEIRTGLRFYKGRFFVTPNIRSLPAVPAFVRRRPGEPLRIAFLSRIDRKKNLLFALEVLAAAGLPVVFSIYGPPQQPDYWQQCQARIATMPDHVSVVYHGAIGQAEVPEAMAGNDLFFLPTKGENFGHAIVDALAAGTPALLSDQTPWRGLEAEHAGWDIPLADTHGFVAAIRSMAEMPEQAQRAMRAAARAFVEGRLGEVEAVAAAADCFTAMIGQAGGGADGPIRDSGNVDRWRRLG
jgi:glycosyltransferase involved in cell wall biosynthesis